MASDSDRPASAANSESPAQRPLVIRLPRGVALRQDEVLPASRSARAGLFEPCRLPLLSTPAGGCRTASVMGDFGHRLRPEQACWSP